MIDIAFLINIQLFFLLIRLLMLMGLLLLFNEYYSEISMGLLVNNR